MSRSLYSKKIVLATMLAFIMVGSAFVVSVQTTAGSSSTNIKVEGWTLLPGSPHWTEGNLKGYVEGEVVPVRLTIPNPTSTIGSLVTVKIGFDHCYGPSFSSPLYYGYEAVVPYKGDGLDPSPPYIAGLGILPGYVIPFYVKPSEGNIETVTHDSNPADPSTYVREGFEWVDVWTVTVKFKGLGDIHLKTGGLLALSADGKCGASFYPGSKLHFGLVEEGKRTVSCNVDGMVLTPPHMVMQKSVDPVTYINGETITFVMHMENTGQADAKIMKIIDLLPLVSNLPLKYLVAYQPGSTKVWTSFASTPVFWKNPDLDWFDMKMRLTWDGYPIHDGSCNPVHPGTSHDYVGDPLFYLTYVAPIPHSTPLIVSMSFQVKVIDPGLRFHEYVNTARVWYEDSQCLEGQYAEDSCSFWIIEPKIDIKKESIPCAAGPYFSGYPENSEGLGDTIAYRITLENKGDVTLNFWVSDPDLAPYLDPPVPSPSDWIWTGSLIPDQILSKVFKYVVKGTETEIEVSPGVYKFQNKALVIAKDANDRHAVSQEATCDVDIFHPSVKITKTADRDKAIPGEWVYFTITIQNPDPADAVPADTDLYVNVYDMLLKPYVLPISPMSHPDPKALISDNIPKGTTKTYTYVEVPLLKWQVPLIWPRPMPETETNTAILYGHDTQEHKITRTSSKDIDLVDRCTTTLDKMAVMASGSKIEKNYVGTDLTVWYYIKVGNPSDGAYDTDVWFAYIDDLIGGTWDDPLWSGHLDIGETSEKWFQYMVPASPTDDWLSKHIVDGKLRNTVTCRLWHNGQHPEFYKEMTDHYDVNLYATIKGIVFEDTGDGTGYDPYDGIWETGEVGLGPDGSGNEFVVTLYHYVGLTKVVDKITYSAGPGDPLPLGEYEFTDVIPRPTYWIEETPITGWFVTKFHPREVTNIQGLETRTENIGNAQYGRITGFKWLDKDHDGEFDEGYLAGLNDWTIKLWGTEYDGTVIPDSDPLITTTHTEYLPLDPANPDGPWVYKPGFYSFDDLKPGKYRVAEVVKPGWHAITPSSRPANPAAWLDLDSGEVISCENFGNAPCIYVYGYKFYDKDMDKVWDREEPALDGFTMRLYEKDEDGKWTVLVAQDVTDMNGKFEFIDVHPGLYLLIEYFPSGFKYGTGDDWYMTNADELNPPGQSREGMLIDELEDIEKPNQNPGVRTDDIGDMRYAKIKGYLFKDSPGFGGTWPNGDYDHPWEKGIVTLDKVVKLHGWTAEPTPKEVTELSRTWYFGIEPWNGWYMFCKLKPGTYTVESLWQEIHWIHTTPVVYTIPVPTYYMGDAPVVFDEINFGYMQTCADPWWPFELQKGWNLWSTPMVVSGLTASSLLQTIGSNAAIITKLDKVTGKYSSFRLGYPSELDFPIALGEGYYIYAKATTSFALVGEFLETSTVNLVKGWNIIGHDQIGAISASDLLSKVQGCNAKIVTYLDPYTQKYNSYRPGYPDELNFGVIPGGAYFLYVDAPGTIVY